MKPHLLSILMIAIVACAGCSKHETITLIPDESQSEAGTTITLEADDGDLHIAPNSYYPKGLNEKVHILSRPNSLPGSTLSLKRTQQDGTLSFVVSQGKYTCTECALSYLPIEWHLRK